MKPQENACAVVHGSFENVVEIDELSRKRVSPTTYQKQYIPPKIFNSKVMSIVIKSTFW